ncbi:MAG: flagellar hook-length control protein FliK [Alkalispirochaeta sp.]
MYGIIPAASPPDSSYGLAPREAVPRSGGGAASFADQLAELRFNSSEHGSHEETARIDAGSEKRPHDAEQPAQPTRSSEDDSRKRAHASPDESRSEKQAHRDSHDVERKTSPPDKSDTANTTEKSASSDNNRESDRADQNDQGDWPSAVEAKLHERKRADRSGDHDSHKADKDGANLVKALTEGEPEKVAHEARRDQSGEKARKERLDGLEGAAKSAAAKGKGRAGDKANADAEKSALHAGDGGTENDVDESAARTDSHENEKNIPRNADQNTERQTAAAGASGEMKNVEPLVNRKGQSDASQRDRRIRSGKDPRERRLATEKADTKTVDVKAGTSAEAENTSAERTVTRELTVDLSDSAASPRDGGEGNGNENSLTGGRMEVALGERSSRPPSVSQATQTLARRLNGELGDSIVRQAKVMLQDANNAELRLVVRPPELGRIRIRLQMENGHIAGRILVDNGSVREVVEQNLASLQRAFEEAGLEMGDLEVSTGDARDDAEHKDQDQNGSAERTVTSGAESFGRSIETISEYEPGRHRINLVA